MPNYLMRSKFKGGSCRLCNKSTTRLERHHLSYRPEITIDICHACHFKIHHAQHLLKQSEIDRLNARLIAKGSTKRLELPKARAYVGPKTAPSLTLSHSLSHDEAKRIIKKSVKISPSRREFLEAMAKIT